MLMLTGRTVIIKQEFTTYLVCAMLNKPFIYSLSFNPDKNSMRITDEETELQRNNLH